jgi:transcriptional regulator with XRE-family HTH domain
MRKAKKSASASGAENISTQLCGQVRKMRKKNHWTLAQLSAASGVSRSMLSQIERNQANPTLGVAYRIAQAFGLSLNDLVDQPKKQSAIDVILHDDRSNYFRNDVECRIRTLSPLQLEKDVEFYELILHPGKTLRSAPHFEGTREFLTIEQGSVRLTSAGESCELNKGDSAHYAADVPHSIENTGKTEVTAFLVDIYRKS